MNRSTLASFTGAIALALGNATAAAQTKWDMPTPYVDAEFHTANIRQFAEEVKKATNGALDIVVHSGQSLIKHPDILRSVSTGQVNIGEFLVGQFSNEDVMFEIDNMPFLAAGWDNAWKFYQAHKPHLEKSLQKRGLRLLYSVAWPGQGIYTKTPLKTVDDLKGTKFRTYSSATARMAELLGASPTVIQATDIPQAFATNTVQAMITSSATGNAFKSWEYSKYYYNTAAFHPRNAVVVNERAFQRLPDNVKKAVTDAAAAAEKRGWEMGRARESSGNKTLIDNGMTFVEPDAAMKAAFAKVGEQMLAEWLKKAGADGDALVKAYRGK
jgi:TRAP-type C4-dicarboxylate transport system substrate-binding protein